MIQTSEITKFSIDGDRNCPLFTEGGVLIARGYERLIFSGGKPYLEFTREQLVLENLAKPDYSECRRKHPEAYYKEYKSKDGCCKLIMQLIEDKNKVPEMWYISTTSLLTKIPGLKLEESVL